MSIPKTGTELIAELNKVKGSLTNLQQSMLNAAYDVKCTDEDRDLAKCLSDFCTINITSIDDAIVGANRLLVDKEIATSSVIAALLRK